MPPALLDETPGHRGTPNPTKPRRSQSQGKVRGICRKFAVTGFAAQNRTWEYPRWEADQVEVCHWQWAEKQRILYQTRNSVRDKKVGSGKTLAADPVIFRAFGFPRRDQHRCRHCFNNWQRNHSFCYFQSGGGGGHRLREERLIVGEMAPGPAQGGAWAMSVLHVHTGGGCTAHFFALMTFFLMFHMISLYFAVVLHVFGEVFAISHFCAFALIFAHFWRAFLCIFSPRPGQSQGPPQCARDFPGVAVAATDRGPHVGD